MHLKISQHLWTKLQIQPFLARTFTTEKPPGHLFLLECLDPCLQKLIQIAVCARKNAYAPYSNFKVGAAVLTECGKVFAGCNVENAAISPSSCAERNAICNAVCDGRKKFKACAVVAGLKDEYVPPCGVCRQFINEFACNDIPVYLAKDFGEGVKLQDKVLLTSLKKLYPAAYKLTTTSTPTTTPTTKKK